MHAHWIMDDTPPTHSATNDTANQWSTSHGHGCQRCRHLHSWQLCAFPPPSTLLTTNPISPAGPRTQHRTQDIPQSHPTPHHTPSTSINSHHKGHMQQHRQGIQSTQTNQPAILQAHAKVDHLVPTEEICAAHDVFCFAALANLHTRTMYTDGTSAFSVRLFWNMRYVFVAYIYDLNTILV